MQDRVTMYVTADQVLVVVERHEAKEGMGCNNNTPDNELDDKLDDGLDDGLDDKLDNKLDDKLDDVEDAA